MAVRGTGTAFPHAYPPSFTYISVCIILKRKRKHTAIPIFPLTIDEFPLCIRSMNTTPISSKMCHPNGYPRGVQERQAWLATTGDPPPICVNSIEVDGGGFEAGKRLQAGKRLAVVGWIPHRGGVSALQKAPVGARRHPHHVLLHLYGLFKGAADGESSSVRLPGVLGG